MEFQLDIPEGACQMKRKHMPNSGRGAGHQHQVLFYKVTRSHEHLGLILP